MPKQAKIRISINEKHKETIETEIIVYDRQLAVFAYNDRLRFAGRVENKDGSEYYTANIPKENLS